MSDFISDDEIKKLGAQAFLRDRLMGDLERRLCSSMAVPSALVGFNPDNNITTYANLPAPPVTLESVRAAIRELGPPIPPMTIHKIPMPLVSRQRRKHRKARINKKWRKRYGTYNTPDPTFDTSHVWHHKVSGAVYMGEAAHAAFLKAMEREGIGAPAPFREIVNLAEDIPAVRNEIDLRVEMLKRAFPIPGPGFRVRLKSEDTP